MSDWNELEAAFGELPKMTEALAALAEFDGRDIVAIVQPLARDASGVRPIQMAAVVRGVMRHGRPRLSQTFSDEPETETETVFFTVGEDFNGFYIVARAVESVSRSGGWTEINMGSVAIALQAADAD